MTGEGRKERDALRRLADLFAEDVLNTPDKDVIAEFQATGGNPDKDAAATRALFEKAALAANKSRLKAAQAGVAAYRLLPRPGQPIDMVDARERLRRFLENASAMNLTLAARKEGELSDEDVLGMLEDLSEIGALPLDNYKGGR